MSADSYQAIYIKELAGWLATLEGGSPFGKHSKGSEVIRMRILTLKHGLTGMTSTGYSRDSAPYRAAEDLIQILEGRINPYMYHNEQE